MKRNSSNQKGFTLAELLIVVAIIAVLVVIAIPIFTSQLEKSRESTDFANVRSAYAELMMAANGDDASAVYNGAAIKQGDGSFRVVVSPLKQQKDGWSTNISSMQIGGVPSGDWTGSPQKLGSCTITYSPSTGKTALAWSNGYENLTLTQLKTVDNAKRIAQDQKTLTKLGDAILAKGWTKEQLFANLGITVSDQKIPDLNDLSQIKTIRIADYYQLKNGSYGSGSNYSSGGFLIASGNGNNTAMSELLQSIGFDGGNASAMQTPKAKTSGDLNGTLYTNSLFYSDQLASNNFNGANINETKRCIILNDIKTDSNGVIKSFTIQSKAMDGQANMSEDEKKQFSIYIE